MSKFVKLSEEAYKFEGKLSLSSAIPLGLQHVLAMFVGNLTPVLIIGGACGIVGGAGFEQLQVVLIQNAMIVAGLVTLLQLYSVGPCGGKVPIIMVQAPALSAYLPVSLQPWEAVLSPMALLWVLRLSAVFLKQCLVWCSSVSAVSFRLLSAVLLYCPSVCR